MWNIIERKLKSTGAVYVAQVRRPGAKSKNKTFPTRSGAEKHGREEDERARKASADQDRGAASRSFFKERLKDVIKLYLPVAEREGVKYDLVPVLEHFDDVSMANITPGVVRRYIEKMLATKSRLGRFYKRNSIKKHLSAIAQAFKWRAREYDLDVTCNAFSGQAGLKGYDEKRTRRLSAHEERRLFKIFRSMGSRGHPWRLLLKLALETGARQQELFLSTWDEFDFVGRVWTIPEEHTKCNEERSVPLSKRAFRCLLTLRRLYGQTHPGPFAMLTSCANIRSAFRQHLEKAGSSGSASTTFVTKESAES